MTSTLIVTSSWPRTRDEIAGTFVRADALARPGRVIAAIPAGPGEARGGVELCELPHLGLLGSPGAAARAIAAPHRILGLFPFALAIASLPRADRAVAHWLFPSGAIVRALYDDAELIAHGADARLLEGLPRAISARFLRYLGRVRSVSSPLAARLLAIEPSLRIDVAPLPISFDRAQARDRGASLRARFGSNLHVVAARLIAAKRIERAVEHAAARRGRLVLVGDGPARARLLVRARTHKVDVISPGAVAHEEALGWIAAAQVVLAPLARGEGAPTVIREAEALGVPTVVFA